MNKKQKHTGSPSIEMSAANLDLTLKHLEKNGLIEPDYANAVKYILKKEKLSYNDLQELDENKPALKRFTALHGSLSALNGFWAYNNLPEYPYLGYFNLFAAGISLLAAARNLYNIYYSNKEIAAFNAYNEYHERFQQIIQQDKDAILDIFHTEGSEIAFANLHPDLYEASAFGKQGFFIGDVFMVLCEHIWKLEQAQVQPTKKTENKRLQSKRRSLWGGKNGPKPA